MSYKGEVSALRDKGWQELDEGQKNDEARVGMIREVLGGLATSADPRADMMAVGEAMAELCQPIDAVLAETNAVNVVLSLIDGDRDGRVTEAALKLLNCFLGLSPFPCPIIAENGQRLVKLLERNDATCLVVGIIIQMLRKKREYVRELVFDLDMLSLAVSLIGSNRYSEQAVGSLFELVGWIFKAMKLEEVQRVIGGKPAFEIPKEVVQGYVSAASPHVVLHCLNCLNAMVHRWPGDLGQLVTRQVVEKLVEMTRNMETIDPGHVGDILSAVVDIWNVWALTFIERDYAQSVIGTIVPLLANLMNNFSKQSKQILTLFSNVAYHSRLGINEAVYKVIMAKFDEVPYANKELLMMIFCKIAVDHAHDIIEMPDNDYPKLLLSALEVAEQTNSDKLTLAFLKSVHALFSADDELIDGENPVIDPQELREFLETCISESKSRDVFEMAELIKQHFFSEKTDAKDLLFTD